MAKPLRRKPFKKPLQGSFLRGKRVAAKARRNNNLKSEKTPEFFGKPFEEFTRRPMTVLDKKKELYSLALKAMQFLKRGKKPTGEPFMHDLLERHYNNLPEGERLAWAAKSSELQRFIEIFETNPGLAETNQKLMEAFARQVIGLCEKKPLDWKMRQAGEKNNGQ